MFAIVIIIIIIITFKCVDVCLCVCVCLYKCVVSGEFLSFLAAKHCRLKYVAGLCYCLLISRMFRQHCCHNISFLCLLWKANLMAWHHLRNARMDLLCKIEFIVGKHDNSYTQNNSPSYSRLKWYEL